MTKTEGGLSFLRVLLVPDLDGRLLSVARLKEKGMRLTFLEGKPELLMTKRTRS